MLLRKIKDNIFSTSNESILIGNSGILLMIFILLFVLPIIPDRIYPIFTTIVFSAIFIGLGFVLKRHRNIVYTFVVIAIVSEWIAHWADLIIIQGISQTITILLFNYVVFNLLLQIVRSKDVDAGVIISAINGYLLTGIAFSLILALIHVYDPGAFNFKDPILNFADYSYFGLVTFSTLGYGDITPLTPLARSFSTLTTISGQIYLAVIIAMLVGKFASANQGKEHKEDSTNHG